ncbi:hypothetical protein F5Y14DRAFT_434516 [Nemania sp. NC0429]|nr:hypothetical protein F5Y14DRAFT_434516 [Nemania sp. NC0429]
MSSMSRNNSVNSLMGFSVRQPAIGEPLQFFPAMGSLQLDEMIDAYIPGEASILDKRAAVSMEFFEYSNATGDHFKFFMVYPALGSTSTSPMTNSGSFSGFTTSPVISESHRASHSPRMVSPSSSKKATANDFCNLPGMKIMTKDGRDVTNSASRGCKTKEQRDHAHLMRIIKACDSCRRKKTKCDPSHKRSPASTSSGKITKKATKNTRSAAAPPQRVTAQASISPEFDQILLDLATPFDSLFTESLSAPIDEFSQNWDQFIQYDEEPTETISSDYDFFLDPAGYFSPTATGSLPSSSTSPSTLPITPIDRDVNIIDNTAVGHDHKPILPYLNPGGLEAGDNYVDFDLYSPQSSFLDEELGFAREVAASPIQSQYLGQQGRRRTDASPEAASSMMVFGSGNDAASIEPIDHYRQDFTSDIMGDGLYDTFNYMHDWSGSTTTADGMSNGGLLDPQYASRSSDRQALPNYTVALSIANSVIEGVTPERPDGLQTMHKPLRPRLNSDRRRRQLLVQQTAGDTTADLQEQQSLPQGRVLCHAGGVSPATNIQSSSQSSSPQRHVIRTCGQDGLDNAKRSETTSMAKAILVTQTMDSLPLDDGSVSCSRSSRIVFKLNIVKDHLHRIRFIATAPSIIQGIPVAETPSPSPAATRTQDTRWRTGELSSRSTSDTLPSMSAIAGSLSLAIPPASRTTTTRNSDLVEDAQLLVTSNAHIYTTAVLLFSLALCLAWPIISLLSSSTLLITAGSIHLRQTVSRPFARSQPLYSYLTRKLLSTTKRLPIDPIDPIDNVKFSFARFLHLAQCEITTKLKPYIDSRTPAITKSSRQEFSQKLGRKSVMSRI